MGEHRSPAGGGVDTDVVRIATLCCESTELVWVLRSHAGQQYSPVERDKKVLHARLIGGSKRVNASNHANDHVSFWMMLLRVLVFLLTCNRCCLCARLRARKTSI